MQHQGQRAVSYRAVQSRSLGVEHREVSDHRGQQST